MPEKSSPWHKYIKSPRFTLCIVLRLPVTVRLSLPLPSRNTSYHFVTENRLSERQRDRGIGEKVDRAHCFIRAVHVRPLSSFLCSFATFPLSLCALALLSEDELFEYGSSEAFVLSVRLHNDCWAKASASLEQRGLWDVEYKSEKGRMWGGGLRLRGHIVQPRDCVDCVQYQCIRVFIVKQFIFICIELKTDECSSAGTYN